MKVRSDCLQTLITVQLCFEPAFEKCGMMRVIFMGIKSFYLLLGLMLLIMWHVVNATTEGIHVWLT